MADNIARGMASTAMSHSEQVLGQLDNIDASLVPYNNETSGLTADDAQSAIDELKSEAFVVYTDGGILTEDFESATPKIPYSGTYTRTTETPYAGNYCLKRSGDSSVVLTFALTIPSDGNLSFTWKFNSGLDGFGCDGEVLLDGQRIAFKENNSDYTTDTVSIEAGTYELTFRTTHWNYGGDIWVDNISIPAPRIYNQSIFEHDDLENVVGNGGKLLAVKSDESGIEYKAETKSISFYIDDVLTVEEKAMSVIVPYDLEIKSIKMAVDTAPTGATLICDINKNGTTLYTTQANRPTIEIDATTETATLPDVVLISAGDKLTLDIDQIGSTVAGANLSVTVICEVA